MDSRIIKDIQPYTNSLITDLEPVRFQMCNNNKPVLGIVAQEAEKIEPLLIQKNVSGIKSIDYENLTVALLATIKDLKTRIEVLENNIKNKPKIKK